MKTRSATPFLARGRFAAVLAFTALAICCSPPAFAQTAGSISGRVHNEVTGQFLNNARVSVKGTDISVFTDETGTFRISGVPSGEATLEVLYSDLDPRQITVDVPPGQTVQQNVELTNRGRYGEKVDIVKLDPFVASSSKMTEGEALATNEQRYASNIKNVVATDAFGDVTEGNVAEFMKFLPGVTIEYSDASPNAVAVRGFDPNMTSVTADGSSLANALGSAASRGSPAANISRKRTRAFTRRPRSGCSATGSPR